jgi:hypothetical protein
VLLNLIYQEKLTQLVTNYMEIKFDYRFDTEGFFTEEKKAALEKAADIWSNSLQDDFAEVSPGIEFTIQNPQTGTTETIVLEETVDDLIIFVGAASEPFNGVATEIDNSFAQAQYHGNDAQGDIFQRRISSDFRGSGAITDFEPWVGTISFTANPDREWDFNFSNSDPNKLDFISVALQQIGRVLGVGTAPIFDVLAAEGSFAGVNAIEANDGNPIPLEDSLNYLAAEFTGESLLLDSEILSERRSLSALDLAILADIGYQIQGYTKQGLIPEISTAEGELILGTIVDDTLYGEDGDDSVEGNAGLDIISGGEGNDSLLGGIGQDTIQGDLGNDTIFGESGSDFITGNEGDDLLDGEIGYDTIRGGDGNDTISGGVGGDLLFGNSGEDLLQGDNYNDSLRGGDDSDTLLGQTGDDALEGGQGDDTLVGDEGKDRFEFGYNSGNDLIEDFIVGEDKIVVSARYDFATDTYDINNESEVFANLTSGSSVSELTIRSNNLITINHNEPLTVEDFEIYFPFQAQITPTNSGFIIQLNEEFNPNTLNLYQGSDPKINVPDLRLVQNSTGEAISGSLIPSFDNRSLRFVKADGLLAPGDYTLTLFGRGDSFISSSGKILDGDFDGIERENLITEFTVETVEERVLSFNDFSRGAGQPVNLPANQEGIDITLDDGADVTQVDFTLTYDADILTIEDILVNPELENDWTLTTKDLTNPGTAIISLSGTTPLASGEIDLVQLQALVPETASYNDSAILALESVSLNEGEIAIVGDTIFQEVAYLGDANGDRNYTNLDSYYISRLATGINDGLVDFNRTNPQVIADINADGVISAFDSYLVAQKVQGATVDLIPEIPE